MLKAVKFHHIGEAVVPSVRQGRESQVELVQAGGGQFGAVLGVQGIVSS
jgi:hypothetical protein